MAIVGMDPKTVFPASSKLQNASTTLNHTASAAARELANPGDLPPDFLSRSIDLGADAGTALTSADAMAVHSVDLSDRAKLFQALEQDTPMTAAARGANLDHLKLLWNPAGRHRSFREPGGYWGEVNAILHPKPVKPGGGEKPANGYEHGGEDKTDGSIKGESERSRERKEEQTRTNFNQPGERPGDRGRPGIGPPPTGGRDRPDLRDIGDDTIGGEYGRSYEQKVGAKYDKDLGHGFSSESEAKLYAETHAKVHGAIGRHGIDAEAEAGMSAGAEGHETLATKYGGGTATAGVKVGVTVGGGAHAQYDHGHLRVGAKISAAIGLGGTLSVSLDINVGAIAGIFHHHDAPKPPPPGVPTGSHAADGSAVISDATKRPAAGAGGGAW